MLKNFALATINFYQRGIKIFWPASCCFSPSCSEYAKQAIEKYGLLQGSCKGLVRIVQCHPLSGKSGYHPLT